ncbi:hypothetical protein [Spirochaeta dissipatitropha]
MKHSLKLIFSTAVILLIGFSFFLVLAIYDFPISGVDRRLMFQWITAEAFIRWFDVIVVQLVMSALLCFSLLVRQKELPSDNDGVVHHMQGFIVFSLVIVLLFAVIQYGFYPQAVRSRADMLRRTERGRVLRDSAEEFRNEDDFAAAIVSLREYISIWEDDDDAQLELLALQRELIMHAGAGEQEEEQETISRINVREQQAGDLLVRAERLYLQEEFFSALFYAQLAYRIDSSRADIATLITRIEEKIGSVDRSDGEHMPAEEQMRQYLFRNKMAAMDALMNNNPVPAYYILLRLQKEFPTDPDVRRYLPIAIEGDDELGIKGVRDLAYFITEAQDTLALPGFNDLYLLLPDSDDGLQLYTFGKMVYGGGGVYFQDIEWIRSDCCGEIIEHVYAPYGRLVSGGQDDILISLFGIHPQYDSVIELPRYYYGSSDRHDSNILQLPLSLRDMEGLSASFMHELYIPLELYRAMRILPRYGFDPVVPSTRFLLSIIQPFSLFFLLIFSFGLSVRWHSRYFGILPFWTWGGILLLPLFTLYAVRIYEFVVQLFTSSAIALVGIWGAAAVMLFVYVVMFSAVLVFAIRELLARD